MAGAQGSDSAGGRGGPACGVRLRAGGLLVWAQPVAVATEPLAAGDWVLVQTAAGREVGRVVAAGLALPATVVALPLLGPLTPAALARERALEEEAEVARRLAGARAAALDLPLRPVQARYVAAGSGLVVTCAVEEGDAAKIDAGAPARLAADLTEQLGLPVTVERPPVRATAVGGAGRLTAPVCCTLSLPDAAPGREPSVCSRLDAALARTGAGIRLRSDWPHLNARVQTPTGAGRVVRIATATRQVIVALDGSDRVAAVAAADLRAAPGRA